MYFVADTKAGSRISPYLVVGLFFEFRAEGSGEHHHEQDSIYGEVTRDGTSFSQRSRTRPRQSAFKAKALGGANHPAPRVINTDGHAAYPPAVAQLKAERRSRRGLPASAGAIFEQRARAGPPRHQAAS
jgi:hypothetical protein